MSLATKILGDDIVGISINTDKIVEVIRNIASRQREQDSRISEIESRLDDFFKNNTQKIDLNQIENFQSFIGTACEKFKALELNLKSLQNQINDVKESIEKKMQDSINDMMVTQSITNKSSFDAFESRINNLSDSVSEISGNLMKNNEEISNFPKEFTDLNSRVKYLYQEINRINQKMKNEEDSKKSAKNEDQSNNTSNNINSNKNNEKPPANFDTVKILIDQTVSQKINKEKLRNVIKNEVLNEVNDEIDKKLSKIRQIFTFPNNYTSQQDTQNNSNTNISNNPNNNLKNNLNNNNENSNQDKDALKNIENKNNDSNNNNNSNSNNNNSNSNNNNNNSNSNNNNNNSNINNDASKVVELSAKTAFLTSSLMNVSNTLAKLESRVEELEKNNSKSLSHNGNSKSSDSSYGIQKTLYDFGLLLEQCNKQSADHDNKIKSLSNQLSNLTCQIKDALYLMIDDFRLIHSHADGMEEKFLPDYSKSSELFKDDLNFEKNTSKYCMRFPPKDKNRQIDLTFPKTSESSEYSESKEDFSELNPNNRSNSNFIHIIGNSDASFDDTQFAPPPSKTIKKMTGLLHLVTSHAKRVERRTVISNHIVHAAMNHHHQNNSDNEQQSAQSQKLNQNSVEDSNEIESLNDLNNSNQENNKRVNFDLSNSDEETSNQDHDKDQNNNNKLNLDDKQMNGLHRNLEESSSFANARELCFMLGQFRREKDELMTSIDRKVDRVLVERLFNKFRIVVNEISEKINNLQNGSDKFATVKQIEGVIKMIAENKAAEKANKDFSTAVGRAPIHECLVCGRNVSSVAGQICPSARSLGACEDSSQFIYGDGGVFRKASERQSFIPRTKLPPLKDIPV